MQLVKLLIARRDDLHFLEARTGQDGLYQAVSHTPDIIFLDISLPDMDGNQVLKALRGNPATATTPVIAISGNTIAETRHNSPGFQEYLSKPIDIHALYGVLDDFIG